MVLSQTWLESEGMEQHAGLISCRQILLQVESSLQNGVVEGEWREAPQESVLNSITAVVWGGD